MFVVRHILINRNRVQHVPSGAECYGDVRRTAAAAVWRCMRDDDAGDDCGSEDSCDLTGTRDACAIGGGLVAAPKTAKARTCCGARMNANRNARRTARDQRGPSPSRPKGLRSNAAAADGPPGTTAVPSCRSAPRARTRLVLNDT